MHHLKRGKALRLNAGPDRPCLCCQPVEPASRHERCEEGPRLTGDGGRGGRGPPVLPSVQRLGSRRERRGQGEEHATCRVLCASSRSNTGGVVRDVKASGSGGKGDPNATPTPSGRVGWGRGVCTRASRAHQDEDGWRRPLACEKRETQGPSARASCPRVDTGGTGAMGTDASWNAMENNHRC